MFRKAAEKARRVLEQPVNKAFAALGTLFADHADALEQERPVLALIRAVMPPDGPELDRVLERFAGILAKQGYPAPKVRAVTELLKTCYRSEGR